MQRFAITSLCVLTGAGILWLLVEGRGATESVEAEALRPSTASESPQLGGSERAPGSGFASGSSEASRSGASDSAAAPSASSLGFDRSIDQDLETTIVDVDEPAPVEEAEAWDARDARKEPLAAHPELPDLEQRAAELALAFGLADSAALTQVLEGSPPSRQAPGAPQPAAEQAAATRALSDEVVVTVLAFKKYGPDATPQQIQSAKDWGTTFLSLPEGDKVRVQQLQDAPNVIPILPPQYLAPEEPAGSGIASADASARD